MKISQKIIDYAIWYYLKYYPSPKKLALKLEQKFWEKSEKWKKYWGITKEEIDFIIKEKLKNILQEEEVIKAKIKSYKNKGKSKKYIILKMFERLENMDLVRKNLDEIFWEDGELENLKKELKKYNYSDDLNYEEKQKIFLKIIRKWYNWEDLKKVI